MDDSLFARLGYDPVRIHTHLYGGPPPPCGIVRLSPRAGPADAEAEAPPPGSGPDPGAEAPTPAPSGEPAGPSEAPPPADAPPADPSPAPPAAHPSHAAQPADHDLAEDPPDAADLHAWLARNRDTIMALDAAGLLLGAPPGLPAASAPAPALPPPPPSPPPPSTPPLPPPPPVHVRRGDRWNKPKMAEFLRQLAATHSVSDAARAVGMHRRSAYKLRARLKGQPFDIAWEAAFRHGYDNLAHAALDRAINGVEVPHYHGGELVGTSRKFDERLTVALLAMRNRAGAPMLGRYGAVAEWSGDRWDALLERVETGSVDWSDEHAALGEAGLAKLGLPDAEREEQLLIARNAPDERPGPGNGR